MVIGIAIGLNEKPIEAQIVSGITSITIQTSNGTMQSTGALKFFGTNGMTVTNNGTGLIFTPKFNSGNGINVSSNSTSTTITNNRIVTTGSLQQITWNPQYQNNYLSVQMELNSQYPELVRNTQCQNKIISKRILSNS